MSADAFISYKSEEENYAKRVRDVLEANGISCWMAPDSIPAGSDYMNQIPKAINECRVMIVLLSEKSQRSTWVRNEFSQAVTKGKMVIPYVIQDCPIEDDFAFSMSTMQQVFAWKDEEAALQKIVRDIRDALGEDPSAKVEISIVHKHGISKKIIVAAAAAVLICAGGLWTVSHKKNAETVPANTPVQEAESAAAASEVYYSEVIPYILSGSYATAAEAERDDYTMPEYDKAFALLSFIRNETGKPVFVEKIACDILELEPVHEPVLCVDGVLENGRIGVFVYNDGWGDAQNVQVSWNAIPSDGVPSFPALEEQLSGSAVYSVASGSVQEVMLEDVDFSELLSWARKECEYSTTLYTLAVFTGEEMHLGMFLMYDKGQDTIIAEYGGAVDDNPEITLYGILDVDQVPSSIRFISQEAFPLIENTCRIETVIIPTKSCEAMIKGSYQIDGEPYETGEYSVRVSVPYFEEHSMIVGGEMTRELMHTNMNDTVQVKRVLDKYRYDIESILPEDAPRG